MRRAVVLAAATCTIAGCMAGLVFGSFVVDSSIECLPARETLTHPRPPLRPSVVGQDDRTCWDAGHQRLTWSALAIGLAAFALLAGLRRGDGWFFGSIWVQGVVSFVVGVAWLLGR
jgi:hypothetical protein